MMAPTNANVRALNNRILSKLPGNNATKTFVAVTRLVEENPLPPQGNAAGGSDKVPVETGGFRVAQEELDAVERGNLPPSRLHLRVGCIVMLLKNFNKAQGLCNGTRLKVVAIFSETVCVRRINAFRGRKDCLYFPKLWLRSDDVPLPGSVERFQFPFALAFAITSTSHKANHLTLLGSTWSALFSPMDNFMLQSAVRRLARTYLSL